jgi:hypothetical protein
MDGLRSVVGLHSAEARACNSALAAAVRVSDDPETNYLSATHLADAGHSDTAFRIRNKLGTWTQPF